MININCDVAVFFYQKKTKLKNKQNILQLLNVSLFIIKTSLHTSTSITLTLTRNCACVQARSQHLTAFNISDESVTIPPVIHNVPIRGRGESVGKCAKNKENTVERTSALQEGTLRIVSGTLKTGGWRSTVSVRGGLHTVV